MMEWLRHIMGAAVLIRVEDMIMIYESKIELRGLWSVYQNVHELAWMMGWLRHIMGAAVLIRVDCMMMGYME